MKPIKIITDTCSDMTEELRNRHDVASIDFTIYFEGKEINADPWVAVLPKELYGGMRNGANVYTLPATEHEIRTKFFQYMDDYDILYIAACEKQSKTIVKARRVAESIMRNRDDVKIEILDSMNASIGQQLIVLKAAEFRDQGCTIEEIIEKLKPLLNKVIQYATVDTLTYLSRANKINARSAALGDFVHLKPILISDSEGRQVSMRNVRGKEQAYNEIVKLFMENVEDPEEQEVFIIHGDASSDAFTLKKKLLAAGLNCKKITTFCVGPVVGITTGPGMVGLFGFGKEVLYRGI